MNKSNVPYYQVAREALIKWNGLSEEQADKIIEESSFEEVESQVYAQSYITSAATSIGKSLGLNDEEISQFLDEVFGRSESTEMTERLHHELGNKMLSTFRSSKHNYMPQLITDTMEDVHNNWVEDNAGLFFTKKADRGQQYQYLPLELIGWNEAKSDLLFIKPIIYSIGGYADESEIKEECNKRTIKFFETHSDRIGGTLEMLIHNFDDLGTWIAENGLEYDYWTPEIEEVMSDVEFVKGTILPQIREKGFMKDEELMDKLAYSSNPIFDPDGPSRDEIVKELEKLRAKKQELEEEQKTIDKTEEFILKEEQKTIDKTKKLIGSKEDKGPALD